MDRTLGTGYQTNSGKRFFQDENLGAAIQGSDVDEIFLNSLQECVIAAYEQLGVTPANAAEFSPDLQLLQAIRVIGAGAITKITAATATLTLLNAGLVIIDATANNVAITLPLVASANGQSLDFTFQRIDASANAVTLLPSGSDRWQPGTLTGTYSPAPGEIFRIRGDGSAGWNVLRRAPAVFVLTSSATLTVPVGITELEVEVIGAGGGGGGCTGATVNVGLCGAGGGRATKLVQGLIPGTNITVTVGAGGTGGIGGGAAPTGGGTTSFGSYVSATGGGGGSNGTSGGPGTSPGAPGSGSGGDTNLTGQSGGTYWLAGSANGYVSPGGGAAPGMGGAQPVNAYDSNGSSGDNYGNGGNAAMTASGATHNGGAGAGGLVIAKFGR